MENLGERIRKERKALGLTIERMAEITNTSKATIQRIETGSKSPSVALLSQIANVLRKPLTELIGEEPKDFYKLDGQPHKVIDTGNFSLSNLCPFGLISRTIVINYFKADAGAVVPPHKDKGHEWVYVIKGRCIFEYAGTPHELKEGDSIFYDARKTHSVKILTSLESIDLFVRS